MIGTKRVGGRKRALPMTIDLHVMITLENGVYDAVCLEMGLATSSPDLEAVQRDLAELILAHIRGCLEEGRPQDMFVPAPPEYWAEYAEAVASDACHQRKKLPIPKIPKRDGEDEASRWVDRISAHSFVCSSA